MARILVIDDNVEHARVVENSLYDCGYEISIAENGVDGIQLLESSDFDLVITDVLMPEADGLEVLKAVGVMGQGVPVIAMSGGGRNFPAALSLELSRALGATAILYKPFRANELRTAVRQALRADPANLNRGGMSCGEHSEQ